MKTEEESEVLNGSGATQRAHESAKDGGDKTSLKMSTALYNNTSAGSHLQASPSHGREPRREDFAGSTYWVNGVKKTSEPWRPTDAKLQRRAQQNSTKLTDDDGTTQLSSVPRHEAQPANIKPQPQKVSSRPRRSKRKGASYRPQYDDVGQRMQSATDQVDSGATHTKPISQLDAPTRVSDRYQLRPRALQTTSHASTASPQQKAPPQQWRQSRGFSQGSVRQEVLHQPTQELSAQRQRQHISTLSSLERMSNLTLDDVRPRQQESTPPLIQPQPTKDYLEQATREPKLLSAPQPLLIIFDLNGTLLYRPSRRNLTSFVPRPGLEDFLNWLIDEEGKYGHRHQAMVWSSAKPENVNAMVNKLFTTTQRQKVVAVWARDKLGLSAQQYNNKVQVYKELEKIWKDPTVDASYPGYKSFKPDEHGGEQWVEENGWWDQTNTVLVDDSILKAASEPHNLLQVPEFEDRLDQKDETTLHAVRGYIELVARYSDVSAYMKTHPFSKGTPSSALAIAAPGSTGKPVGEGSAAE